MNSMVQLFKYIGAFAAIIVCIGFLSNSDYSLLESKNVDSFKEMSLGFSSNDNATINDSKRTSEYRTPDRLERNRPSAAASSGLSRAEYERPRAIQTVNKKSSRSKNNFSARAIEEWIQMNAAQTYLESEKETMSPGVILATGVYFLQQGKGDMGMNAADVAGYLAEVRSSASAKAKAKMKYIANSDQWFEGLNLAGFDGDKIASIFANHQLKAYDKQMYSRHIERKIENQNYEMEDDALAAEKEERNKNLADAYNTYAAKPEVRKKYGLPTRAANEPSSSKEVSAARLEAESIKLGQSKKYSDPRVFWAVLKEMIAFEHDYNSWEAYEADYSQAANKEFESRSNIMAMGGVMKVTKRKGA